MDEQDKALLREIAATTQDLNTAINGNNGAVGMATRLEQIEAFIKKYTPTLMITKSVNRLGWGIIRTVLGLGTVAIIYFLADLYFTKGITP